MKWFLDIVDMSANMELRGLQKSGWRTNTSGTGAGHKLCQGAMDSAHQVGHILKGFSHNRNSSICV